MQRVVSTLALLISCAWAGNPPSGFNDVSVATGMSSPTAMAFAPDGRLFVLLQGGGVRVIKNGSLLPSPFVSIATTSEGERGLLGIAFDPNFASNQFLYLYYTVPTAPIHNRVSRFTANGDVAVAGSELPLLELNNLTGATNHNGGAMQFGSDGKLYIAVGENATGSNSQTLNNLLGKILRMNPDGSIPGDNPFFNSATGQNRLIWALGLRNPYTFDFQPGTGRFFINDVGQSTFEEINDGIAGSNYGWPSTEGFFSQASFPNFKNPQFTYAHSGPQPTGCAITGGTFYNPSTVDFPASYVGKYFFADFCSNWIYSFDPLATPPSVATPFLTGALSPVDLKVGPDGKLYYLHRGNGGEVRRVESTTSPVPSITKHPAAVTVAAGIAATFTVEASGANLNYLWQRNTAPIAGATQASYTLTSPQASDSGALFRVVVSNTAGSVTSNSALLTITANQPPAATIATPAVGTLFSGGQTIFFTGSGTDPETGALPVTNLKWRVDYITGGATRPFVAEFSGAAGGSFLVPTITPYLLTDVYFLIVLTVRDPQGFETTITRRVDPRVSRVSLLSSPAGRQLSVDGQPVTATFAFDSVVGLVRPIGAPSPQDVGTTRYIFNNWSDGGAATHNISVPLSDSSFTANFNTQFLLTTAVNPLSGGTVTPGGYQNANSSINIASTPNAGWSFTGFSGSLSGSASPQSLLMNSAKAVTANFAPLPSFLSAQVTARVNGSGAGERLWTLSVRNNGTGPAINVRITSIQINIAGGPGPVALLTSLPISLGNINPGATVSPTLNLNFPATTPPTRVSVTITFAGDFGLASTTTLNNLFR